MRHLLIVLFLTIFSFTAFAQFPLGSNAQKIRTYFDQNISYKTAQEFKTEDGINAICFTKVNAVGDYVFYFDNSGDCFTYTVTYDKKELADLIVRFDTKFVRIYATRWTAQDNTFDVTLQLPKPGDNYFSIIYKPLDQGMANINTIASN